MKSPGLSRADRMRVMTAEEQPRGDPKALAPTEWSGKLDAWKAPNPLVLILMALGKNEWES